MKAVLNKKRGFFVLVFTIILTIALLAFPACGNSGGGTGGGSSSGGTGGGSSSGSSGGSSGGGTGGGSSGGGTSSSSGETYNLIVALSIPAESPFGKVWTEYTGKMTEVSNGRLTFEMYFSNQLMPIFELFKGISDGLADMTFLPVNISPDYLPISGKLLDMPMLNWGGQKRHENYSKLKAEFPEIGEEFIKHNMLL